MINIKGKKILLKTFTREEFHHFSQNYISDPVMDPHPFIYDPLAADMSFDAIEAKASWYPVVGIFLPEGRPAGRLAFKRIDHEKSRCELGIVMVNDGFKGKGYGKEAIGLALEHAFQTLCLETVYGDTMGSNIRMQKIFSHFGFKLLSRDEKFYDMGDRLEDRLNYSLSREEWKSYRV